MKRLVTAVLAATLAMGTSAVFAQASGAMGNDTMSHDTMGKSGMSQDSMSKSTSAADAILVHAHWSRVWVPGHRVDRFSSSAARPDHPSSGIR
jgi:pentapeptide MXKDX repeat protein